jgi:hypothetical protein
MGDGGGCNEMVWSADGRRSSPAMLQPSAWSTWNGRSQGPTCRTLTGSSANSFILGRAMGRSTPESSHSCRSRSCSSRFAVTHWQIPSRGVARSGVLSPPCGEAADSRSVGGRHAALTSARPAQRVSDSVSIYRWHRARVPSSVAAVRTSNDADCRATARTFSYEPRLLAASAGFFSDS